jgi:hypothetical protein
MFLFTLRLTLVACKVALPWRAACLMPEKTALLGFLRNIAAHLYLGFLLSKKGLRFAAHFPKIGYLPVSGASEIPMQKFAAASTAAGSISGAKGLAARRRREDGFGRCGLVSFAQ